VEVMSGAGVSTCIMIDASHGNSSKRPENQVPVIESIAQQIEAGDRRIGGVMLESTWWRAAGSRPRQTTGVWPEHTDGCIDWPTSVSLLETAFAAAVEGRRRAGNR